MAHQAQNLVATAISTTEIELSWDDVETLEDETYDIERDSVIVEPDYAGDHSVASPYTDSGLTADTEYTYRVRAVGGTEVGEFAPTDITGLVAWYSFDDIGSLWQDTARTSAITANGQTIKGVTDLSGNGKHLSEATNGPAYTVGIINGLPVARFDGSNDFLSNASMVSAFDWTLFIVAQKRSAPIAASKCLWAGGAGNVVLLTHSTYSATGYVWYANAAAGVSSLGGTATSVTAATMRVNSSSSMDFYANGGTPTNFNPIGSIVTLSTYIYGAEVAGAQAGDFDIGEIIAYDSALSATDLNLVGNYLERWGLTWTDV